MHFDDITATHVREQRADSDLLWLNGYIDAAGLYQIDIGCTVN